jgi:acetyl-CoA carboxylase biotin carboxylase subunit
MLGGDGMRRIEFDIIGDRHGNVVHLGERECSIQHLDQKLVAESPSPSITDEGRRQMGSVVVAAAKAVGYASVGTFKFLMDADGRFSYLGTNTGLQVDHSVTEMVTGIDIVKEQIRAAAGECLSMKQEDVSLSGNAIECRITAEDPDTFLPSPGVIDAFYVVGGPGVRVDSLAHDGCTISPHYDSVVATIIVHGRDRREAIMRMRRTLEMTVIEGIKTSLPLHLRILNELDFQTGRVTTSFMNRMTVNASVCGLAKTA